MRKKRYQSQLNNNNLFLKPFQPLNSAQQYYIDLLRECTVTFCTGPAGTSKTYISIYVALESLLNNEVDKIILTRPIVATEDIGFLPGDMNEKIHPYLIPLFDAVEQHVGPAKAKDLFESGRIECFPLAFMRGRSLRNCIMILDEGQNTTSDQIKMFLTRMAEGSKIYINGDITQNDLPKHIDSGLGGAMERLTGVSKDIGVIKFDSSHIVRHPLIELMLKHLEAPRQPIKEVVKEHAVLLRRSA